MKNLKKFYKNNRIYCILMLVSLVCFILMGSAVVIYFLGQATSSKYGNRLENVSKYEVEKELGDVEEYFKNSKSVLETTVRLQGKIIYITVKVEEKVTNEEIQNLGNGCLEKLTDEQKGFYHLQFIFERDNLTPYMGSKSSSKTAISWANYNFETEEETTTTTKKKK